MKNRKVVPKLDFSEERIKEAALYPGFYLGRVTSQYKNLYKVATMEAEVFAEISGKLRHNSDELSQYPAVGDFVIIDRQEASQGNAIIQQILARKSLFVRRAAGTSHDVQVVAANIDTVFICMSLNNDLNLRRLERYLSITWESGAVPVVVLTKSDLCSDFQTKLLELEKIAIGVDIIVTSSFEDNCYESLLKYMTKEKTVAFIGSSGVGKSTLINRILREEVFETSDIRKDDKGRHTTTRRELVLVPEGGAVIDTPGMREVGVETVDLERAFSDIDNLAAECRFRDCNHESEPGCMVLKAIEEGVLTQDRLDSYRKLKTEAQYDGLNSREIERKKINTMFADFGGIKNARDFAKGKKR
ncbi:MAG: ribosome small subunit-dependent GTPase A [Clostridia bacterium]|nr:ribosome small subunit-dependent GTPase A [Clostridia bacterium]